MESFMKETPVRKRRIVVGNGELGGGLSTGVPGEDTSLFPEKGPGLRLLQVAGAGK